MHCVDIHAYLPLLAGAADHTAKCKAGEYPEFAASLANICYVSVTVAWSVGGHGFVIPCH